jgi:Spy/CpxP family protein refolding chaperone
MKNSGIVKRLIVAAGLIALSGMSAFLRAQEPTPSNGQGTVQGENQATATKRGEMRDTELSKLNLSDDQKAQVKKIREDAQMQMDAVKNDTALSADQKQAKMQQIHKSSHQQVEQVLTPEQRKQMKADEMARKAARQQNGQTPPPQQ